MCLESLSYHEAWELSYFGASVLHPRTTMPAMKLSIPITIRNFFNRSAPGAFLFWSCTIHAACLSAWSQPEDLLSIDRCHGSPSNWCLPGRLTQCPASYSLPASVLLGHSV